MSAFKSGNVRRRGPWDMTPLLVLLLVLLSSLTGPVVSQYEDQDGDGEVTPEEAPEDLAEGVAEEAPEEAPDEAPPEEVTDEVTEDLPATEDGGEDQDLPPSSYTDDGEVPVSESPSMMPDASATPDPNTEDTSGSGSGELFVGEPTDVPPDTSPVIILIPVVLVVVIIAMVVGGIVINRRWNRNKSYKTDHEKGDPYLDDTTEKVPMPMFEEDVPSVLELEMDELDQWMNKDGGTTMDSKQIEL